MALTDSQVQRVYLALGMNAEGTLRYRYRFDFWLPPFIQPTDAIWTYAGIKQVVDARLGITPLDGVTALTAPALVELGTIVDGWASRRFSSTKLHGGPYGVSIDRQEEAKLYRAEMYRLVGIEIEDQHIVPPIEEVNGSQQSISGRAGR
jgi:hypothetical protein